MQKILSSLSNLPLKISACRTNGRTKENLTGSCGRLCFSSIGGGGEDDDDDNDDGGRGGGEEEKGEETEWFETESLTAAVVLERKSSVSVGEETELQAEACLSKKLVQSEEN